MAAADSGHWVRFFQRVKSAEADIGKRTNLIFGSGFAVIELPNEDGIGISLDLTALSQSSWKMGIETRAVTNVSDLVGATTIGSVTLTTAMRVGLFGQTDTTENGLYQYVNGAGLIRSTDADTDLEIRGACVYVRKGDGAGERWRCANTGSAIPDTDAATWTKVESNGDKAKLDGIASGAQVVNWTNIVAAASAASSSVNINGQKVTGASDPSAPSDYVTKQYFDENIPAGSLVSFESSANVSTNNDTVDALTFEVPENAVGKATMHVTIADITNGESNVYELKYKFSRHGGDTTALSSATIVLLDEDDVAWSSRIELDGNDLVVRVTGDSSNACTGRARLEVDYNTYAPV